MALLPLIGRAISENASDIHLRDGSPPRLRINGELYDVKNLLPTEQELKDFFYPFLSAKQIEQFERSNDIDFAFNADEHCRLRGNLFRQQERFCASLRLIPSAIPSIEEIELPEPCVRLCALNKGLILVTGPTGSGKSTTLAVMINHINSRRRCHILTVEDPIEYIYQPGLATITQREVGRDTNDFQSALRHAFRQDPDVVLVGEMRDYETMSTAISLAETGHLTLSTLHTGEASQTINRIIDTFPARQQTQVRMQLSISLAGIVSQQLLKEEEKNRRVAAREVLVCTRAVRNLIREGKIPQIYSAMQTGADDGMITMLNSLGELYRAGRISYEAALAASFDKKEFITKYG
jgi:twitching motility protein PilT